jgi:hypothetical protein
MFANKYFSAAILMTLSMPLSASALIMDGGREARSPSREVRSSAAEGNEAPRTCCGEADANGKSVCQSGDEADEAVFRERVSGRLDRSG